MIQNKVMTMLKQGSILRLTVRQASTASEPAKTCLYDFHVASGGKMVDFAGDLVQGVLINHFLFHSSLGHPVLLSILIFV